jgi:hypothetical protein
MRTADCEDGVRFEREHPSRKRANSRLRLGRAICAFQGVLVNMGGALSDLMQTNIAYVRISVPTSSPEMTAAVEYTEDFIVDYAPLINLPSDRARLYAGWLFGLSILVAAENQGLGPVVKLPESLAQTSQPASRVTPSATASSTSGCPDPTKTPVCTLQCT